MATSSVSSPNSETKTPRRRSSMQSSAQLSVTSRPSRPPIAGKKKRNLLREYYQLGNDVSRDPLDPDSPAFDAAAAYSSLSTSLSLPDLLKREAKLASEIRELDSERQSLVYNHHNELIDASDTIRRMKARAESLDGALDGLASSLEAINQLSAALSASPPPGAREAPSPGQFSPLDHLPPLLTLPSTLRSLLNAAKRDEPRPPGILAPKDEAALAWGEFEPALRAFEDANVVGTSEIAQECRAILARARRGSHADDIK